MVTELCRLRLSTCSKPKPVDHYLCHSCLARGKCSLANFAHGFGEDGSGATGSATVSSSSSVSVCVPSSVSPEGADCFCCSLPVVGAVRPNEDDKSNDETIVFMSGDKWVPESPAVGLGGQNLTAPGGWSENLARRWPMMNFRREQMVQGGCWSRMVVSRRTASAKTSLRCFWAK